MKHLVICREYPPAPSGGIGTYVGNMSRLLAEAGETVHVIGQRWKGAEKTLEERYNGRLVIHRLPCENWRAVLRSRPHSLLQSKTARALYGVDFPPLCFSWLASSLAERLVAEEGIDLVEAQDYEAPLYYFQLRRALGLGPKRHPPCIVHLHSPTEFIARHNEWDLALSRWQTTKRLEDYSILSADALLCPSTFLARQVESQYGLQAEGIEVIPYPLSEIATVERQADVWNTGSICYVGRLEKRKGLLEWIAAAVTSAEQYPNAHFEFVGANVLGPNLILSEAILNRLVPRHLRARFVFHGAVDRSAVPQFLERARIAAVPSRWENFPHTCIEAMASGLPVIASPEGGMKEMIVEGQTGWVAKSATQDGFRDVLRHALDTSPMRLAEMGSAASLDIRHLCDTQAVVEQQMRFRRRLLMQGARDSVPLVSLRNCPIEIHGRTRLSIQEVLADYPTDGLASQEQNPGNEDYASLERFAELASQDIDCVRTQTPYPEAIRSKEWAGGLWEPLATLRCLVGNPRMTLRVLQEVTTRFLRRTQMQRAELRS